MNVMTIVFWDKSVGEIVVKDVIDDLVASDCYKVEAKDVVYLIPIQNILFVRNERIKGD